MSLLLKPNDNLSASLCKKKLVAVRAGIMPGLYSEGVWQDSLGESIHYDVVELHEASDRENYEDNFFVNKEEKELSYELSRRTAHIAHLIEEELDQ